MATPSHRPDPFAGGYPSAEPYPLDTLPAEVKVCNCSKPGCGRLLIGKTSRAWLDKQPPAVRQYLPPPVARFLRDPTVVGGEHRRPVCEKCLTKIRDAAGSR